MTGYVRRSCSLALADGGSIPPASTILLPAVVVPGHLAGSVLSLLPTSRVRAKKQANAQQAQASPDRLAVQLGQHHVDIVATYVTSNMQYGVCNTLKVTKSCCVPRTMSNCTAPTALREPARLLLISQYDEVRRHRVAWPASQNGRR